MTELDKLVDEAKKAREQIVWEKERERERVGQITLLEAAKKFLEVLGDGFDYNDGPYYDCPSCLKGPREGHSPGCERVALIAAVREAVEREEGATAVPVITVSATHPPIA